MRIRCAYRLLSCGLLLLPVAAVGSPRLPPTANLVPNPSFESFSALPSSYSQISLAFPWHKPTTGTSDYFHVRAAWPGVDIPSNSLGFQYPKHGIAYAGLIAYRTEDEYREYLQVPLTAALVAGVEYTVSFWISRAELSGWSVDRLGAHLRAGAVGPVGNYAALPFTPQIESPAGVQLADTLNWKKISGTFVAAGGEDHLLIGSFRDDPSTSVEGDGIASTMAYYYVDKVSVVLTHPLWLAPGWPYSGPLVKGP
jgi:hypothetical protein